MSVNAPNLYLDTTAPDFNLLSTNDKYYKLNDLKGKNGTVIAFICNHCPYVESISKRLAYEADNLKKINISTVAIMPNDIKAYPEDSFENMKIFAKKYHFNFHYLYDSSQKVAKAYNAVCTPDIYGFNKKLILKYRGCLDSETKIENNKVLKRDLFYAMKDMIITEEGPKNQINSIGCSIKWIKDE